MKNVENAKTFKTYFPESVPKKWTSVIEKIVTWFRTPAEVFHHLRQQYQIMGPTPLEFDKLHGKELGKKCWGMGRTFRNFNTPTDIYILNSLLFQEPM